MEFFTEYRAVIDARRDYSAAGAYFAGPYERLCSAYSDRHIFGIGSGYVA